MTRDSVLLQAFRERDEAAFTALAERYHRAIHAACQRQAPPGDVDDCVQAVFLVLSRRPAAAARAPVLLAWLHRVAHFVCRDARRAASRRRRTVTDMPPAPATGHAPETAVLEQLDAALLGLEERQRAAVLLHADGNATGEIAQSLGVTAANASKLVQRGLVALRERLCRSGVPISAAALATIIGSGSTAAAAVPAPALSVLLAHTSTTNATLLANGALMHATVAIAKPWIIAAALVAVLGMGGMIAADVVKPEPAPAAEKTAADGIDHILDQAVTLDLQGLNSSELLELLGRSSGLTIVTDASVTVEKLPSITLQVEHMKYRDVLDTLMKKSGLRYRIVDNVVHVSGGDDQPANALKQAAPPIPTLTLKVRDMQVGDAVQLLSKLTNLPITIDPRLKKAQRLAFEFQDAHVTDVLQFLATVTGGEVKAVDGANPGYHIALESAEPEQTPVLPSAAQ